MAHIDRTLTGPVAAVDRGTTLCFREKEEGLPLSVKVIVGMYFKAEHSKINA